jgi:mRNA-degrading endonuclease RelE of RelBE toxin-antitoxin system
MIIIETPISTKQITSALSEDEYRLFQLSLAERPDAGKVIPGSGGLRKLRWSAEGRGKRGGLRVIYYWFIQGRILLLFVYPKNVQGNLTDTQLKQLKKIVEEKYHGGKIISGIIGKREARCGNHKRHNVPIADFSVP